MSLDEYKGSFEDILGARFNKPPYDRESYVNYVKLNHSRMKRWAKQGELSPELKAAVQAIDQPQKWVVITEPWCGDAANSIPFIEKIASLNPMIDVVVQLRDSGSEIDDYLTNGGRSIPKLIARNNQGEDIFNWGPRPTEAQELVMRQKNETTPQDEKYAELLQWYRRDGGNAIQNELLQLITNSKVGD